MTGLHSVVEVGVVIAVPVESVVLHRFCVTIAEADVADAGVPFDEVETRTLPTVVSVE